MRKRRRWHRFKSKMKNFILGAITVFAFLMLMASMEVLLEQTLKAILVFIISLAWLVLFGHANGWLQECP